MAPCTGPQHHRARDARGLHSARRTGYEKVGGDVEADPFFAFAPGVREWRAELVISPVCDRADTVVIRERPQLGRMHTPQRRQPRVARSPKPALPARSGVAGPTDTPTSRCEEVDDC